MQELPRFIRWAHVVFNLSVIAGGLLGLLFIWHPPQAEVMQKVFGSIAVVLIACTFLLAGYRTVHHRREDA